MKKLHLTYNGLLHRVMLLIALLTLSAGAMAQDIQPITLDTEYSVGAFQSPTYSFTPTESGRVYMYCSSQDYPLLWKDSACTTPYNAEVNPYNNPRWQYDVVAGTTYYLGYGLNFTMDVTTFYLTMSGPAALEAINVQPEVGGVLSVGYPIGITFSVPVDIESAALQGGTAQSVDLGINFNGANASFEVKEILYKWMKDGQLKEGDDVKLTLTGVHATADPDLKGGDNGAMSFTWKSAPMPVALVKESLPANIISKWEEGDPAGIATLEFSGDIADGVIAALTNGDLSKGGTYEALPVSVEGNKVMIDFTGVVRFPAVEDTYVLDVANVNDLAGYPAYSPGSGTVGSYTFSIVFDDAPYIEPVKFEFTPAANADIKGVDQITVKVDNVTSSFGYTAATYFYTENRTQKTATVAKADITEINNGTDITLKIGVPAAVANADGGSNVVLTLVNGEVTIASVTYIYGETSDPDQLTISLVSPADGSTLEMIGADETIDLNITGLPTDCDIEIEGTIVDDATGDVVKGCFFFPTDGAGYNYSCMMYDDVDLYLGHTYTLNIKVSSFPLDEQGFRGAPQVIGTAQYTYYGAGKEFVYSDIELIGMDPNPATQDITSAEQNVVTVTFSGPVATLRVVEPIGFGAGVIDYDVAKANEDGTEWTFTIPESTIEQAKGTIAITMFAYDAEGHPLWKSALWDPFMWTGIPDAMQAKDETCYSIMYKCTVGSPEFEITPADGSKVESLDKFVISYRTGINYSWSSMEPIVLYKGTGDDKEEIQSWDGMYFDPWENTDKCLYSGDTIVGWTLVLDQPQTSVGVYTLVVPNCFFFLGSEFDQANSKQQTATVTIDRPEGITDITSDNDASGAIYNISGQRVGSSYKGIVIKDGKKVINK